MKKEENMLVTGMFSFYHTLFSIYQSQIPLYEPNSDLLSPNVFRLDKSTILLKGRVEPDSPQHL